MENRSVRAMTVAKCKFLTRLRARALKTRRVQCRTISACPSIIFKSNHIALVFEKAVLHDHIVRSLFNIPRPVYSIRMYAYTRIDMCIMELSN